MLFRIRPRAIDVRVRLVIPSAAPGDRVRQMLRSVWGQRSRTLGGIRAGNLRGASPVFGGHLSARRSGSGVWRAATDASSSLRISHLCQRYRVDETAPKRISVCGYLRRSPKHAIKDGRLARPLKILSKVECCRISQPKKCMFPFYDRKISRLFPRLRSLVY